jgi:P27 family predicted phage terminase small subunit
MFGRYCELVALTEECQAAIDANGGPWLPAENGRVYRHPALSTWLEAVAKMRLFGAEFGMSPSARAGLHIPPKDADHEDSLEAFHRRFAEDLPEIAGRVG